MDKPKTKFNSAPQSWALGGLADWPVSWGIAGFALGIGLGVTTLSAWIVTLGLVAFLANMYRHKSVGKYEGRLFATAPFLLIGWVLGFVVRGLAF